MPLPSAGTCAPTLTRRCCSTSWRTRCTARTSAACRCVRVCVSGFLIWIVRVAQTGLNAPAEPVCVCALSHASDTSYSIEQEGFGCQASGGVLATEEACKGMHGKCMLGCGSHGDGWAMQLVHAVLTPPLSVLTSPAWHSCSFPAATWHCPTDHGVRPQPQQD